MTDQQRQKLYKKFMTYVNYDKHKVLCSDRRKSESRRTQVPWTQARQNKRKLLNEPLDCPKSLDKRQHTVLGFCFLPRNS